MKNFILLGLPGSGKGSLGKHIVEKYGLIHISTGDLIREHQKNGTKIGKMADELSDKGMYLPDNVVIQMVKEEVIKHKDANGFIFDGFPRTKEQAKHIMSFLHTRSCPLTAVVYIEAEKEAIIKRIKRRAQLSERVDDSDGVIIEKRINEYESKTKPIIKFFQQKGVLFELNGNKTIEEANREFDSLFD